MIFSNESGIFLISKTVTVFWEVFYFLQFDPAHFRIDVLSKNPRIPKFHGVPSSTKSFREFRNFKVLVAKADYGGRKRWNPHSLQKIFK